MGLLMYGRNPPEDEVEQVVDRTDSATDSSPEPPPEPVRPRIRLLRRVPRPQRIPEQIRFRDEPVDTVEQTNIQVLRVGPRLGNLLQPIFHQPRASEHRAPPNEVRSRSVEATASDNVRAWLATPDQPETQVPVPAAAPRHAGRRMRDARRLFISDGMGSGRSYDRRANRARVSPDENEADRLQQGTRRESPPVRPPSPTGLFERLAIIEQSEIDAVRRMEAEMTPWSLNDDRDGPTPEDIYREAYRRLDNSTATGEERRILQMHVQRGIDGMLREERQSGSDLWPRGIRN